MVQATRLTIFAIVLRTCTRSRYPQSQGSLRRHQPSEASRRRYHPINSFSKLRQSLADTHTLQRPTSRKQLPLRCVPNIITRLARVRMRMRMCLVMCLVMLAWTRTLPWHRCRHLLILSPSPSPHNLHLSSCNPSQKPNLNPSTTPCRRRRRRRTPPCPTLSYRAALALAMATMPWVRIACFRLVAPRQTRCCWPRV